MLDVAASIDAAGTVLSIALVNRSETEQSEVELKVQGAAVTGPWAVHALTASSIHDVNTLKQREKDVVEYRTTSLPEGAKACTVPAHSIVILRVSLAQ